MGATEPDCRRASTGSKDEATALYRSEVLGIDLAVFEGCDDDAVLSRWLERALGTSSEGDVFADMP